MKRNLTKSTIGSNSNQAFSNQNDFQGIKKQIFDLKDLQYDIYKLNDQISNIEAKYSTVLQQKNRNETLIKSKTTLNKANLQSLQSDVQNIRAQIEGTSIEVINLNRDNATRQLQCQNKQHQITKLTLAVRQLEKTNQMKIMQLQELEEMLAKVKEHKGRLVEEYEKCYRKSNETKEAYGELEKQARNQSVIERSLGSNLEKLRREGEDLVEEMRSRECLLGETSSQYQQVCDQTEEFIGVNEQISKQITGVEETLKDVTKGVENAQRACKEKQKKLRELEEIAGKQEMDLNKSVVKKDTLMKQHGQLATTNKSLNSEIDQCLIKILQLETVNKALQKHIEGYIACDEEARMILDRKQKMTELLQTVVGKISKTQSPIAHLI